MLNEKRKLLKKPFITADVAADLLRLQNSYSYKTGEQFKHFFCPLMYRDDQVPLCMGHVLPESYANCNRARVVQRADIDNFYGSVAEAEYGILLQSSGRTMPEVMLDKKLQKDLKPRLMRDDEEVGYYPYRGDMNLQHTRLTVECSQDGRSIDLVLEKIPADMHSLLSKNWGFVVEHDFRLAALATVVKAAYLTMFHKHGYPWALSPGGFAIGYSLLGQFFRENHLKKKAEIKQAMLPAFKPYRHMIRPIERFGGRELPKGTLVDGIFGLCWGSNGKPFAQIIYVRIGDHCDGVLMPAAENHESAGTYFDFLNNDSEKSKFNDVEKCWESSSESVTVHWPKTDSSFML